MKLTEQYAFDSCVYTIVNIEIIDEAFLNEGCGFFIEKKPWVTGEKQCHQSKQQDQIYLLLLANAASIIGIEWIAQIDEISLLPDGGTKISFSGLHKLAEIEPLSALTLQRRGEALSDAFIKPYALCVTPDFAEADTRELVDGEIETRAYVDGYKAALREIDSKITDGQRKMLFGHYAAPEMRLSITQLAELAGYRGAAPGKLHYGLLAHRIADAMGLDKPTVDHISAIAHWDSTKDKRGHGQWVLYNEVALALEELGWVIARDRSTEIAPAEIVEEKSLVMNIKREFFDAIVAVPQRKNVEYRSMSPYWMQRLERMGHAPFNLRLLNGMIHPIPEANICVDRVVLNGKEQIMELHLGRIISVKNWNRMG